MKTKAACTPVLVSTHSRLKAAGGNAYIYKQRDVVSTHSRLKAAGVAALAPAVCKDCFNTQPPKGGWLPYRATSGMAACFNTQPPKGGWVLRMATAVLPLGFNTQPPKGGWLTFVLPK